MANQWAFPEPPDTPATTTKQIMARGPILSIRHQGDGKWEFLDAGPDAADAVSTKLGDFVELNPWVVEFADLPAGSMAWRDHVMAPWQRGQSH
jgi:hypothetical protein